MNKLADLNKDQREFIFRETAFELGLNPVIVEKDYWVSAVLYYLFNLSSYKDYFIFKGGTSLSKCYDVIDRFSEDIDVILKWEFLNFKDEEIFRKRTKNQNNKLNKLLNKKCIEFIKDCLIDELKQGLSKFLNYDANVMISNEDSQTINFYYPSIFSDLYVKPFVRIEIGPVSLKEPANICSIAPFCVKYFPNYFNIKSFEVPTISIERIFYEKILILSNENDRPLFSKMPMRYSRHYYDVFKIFSSNFFQNIKDNQHLFGDAKIFKNIFYSTSWSKYETVTLKSIKIVPCKERLIELKRDYDLMKPMFFGKFPSFDELLLTLKEIEKILNNLWE